MGTTTPAETLEARLARLDAERNALVTAGLDALDVKIAAAEAAEQKAARADDEPARQQARQLKARHLADRAELLETAAAKEQAIAQTKRDILARNRALAVRDAQAYAATAADIAPQVAEALDALCSAARRLKAQLDGAYGVAVTRLGESPTSFARLTGTDRLYGDIAWHLAGALGLPRGHAAHGTALDQAADLTLFASTLR